MIAAEIQCFGENTFATWARCGEGVLYREILIDVCDSMRVNYNAHANIERIEMNLLLKILTDSMDKMTPEDLIDLASELGIKTTNFSKQTLIIAAQTSVKMSGFVAHKVTVIVANAALARAIGIAVGPIGWTLTALWSLKDVAGSAFWVTIPCIVQIAFLRTMINQQNSSVYSRISPDSICR
ncbi:YaaW family protein [Spirobacillus cienkowskii]|uniref:YaaW family protein n=1 Tax=Spirobacillus cienkowskii TaxID=495820 RepID=UPI0030D12DFF